MHIKSKLFRLNISVLILGMVLSAAIAIGFLFLAEDTVENTIESVNENNVDKYALEVADEINKHGSGQWQQLQSEVRSYGYSLLVYKKGKVVYQSIDDEHEQDEAVDLIEKVLAGSHGSSETKLYFHDNSTYVGRYISENDTYVLAAHFSREDWWKTSLPVFIIIGLGFVVGMAIIFFLLSSVFAWKINRMIMKPLKVILDGTEKIKDGDLDTTLEYKGEKEFEEVCNTFNEMTAKMRKDRELRLENEQARTDMVTGISHDLRTPLTSIQGYIKGVIDGVADTEEKRNLYLNTAYESTKEMNVLLQKLFDFSRLESGQIPFNMVPCDLGEYTAFYVAKKEAALERKDVLLKYHGEDRVFPEVDMDVEQVQRIFDNLLENSIKYANAKPVCIDLTVYETESDIVLQWKDNGNGVPEEKIKSIFDRFYRCDEARNEKGSGVGLYIVSSIMECHGGYVTAKNDSGLKIDLHFPRRRHDGKNFDCRG